MSVFPLPENYFEPVQLSQEDAEGFQNWGDSLVQRTLDMCLEEQSMPTEERGKRWKALKQRGGLTVFRRRGHDDPNAPRFLCSGSIDGTLDEVLYGRYADNTRDFRRVSAVYRDDLVDCAVLGSIARQSPENPFYSAGFKWMTVTSPSKGLVKKRDHCWYEQCGLMRTPRGEEIGYTVTESVELATCPPFKECVRAKLSVCYLYFRNATGGVSVYMLGSCEPGGKVVDWIADLKFAVMWCKVMRSMDCAHARIGAALVKAANGTMHPKPNASSGRCEICHQRPVRMMRSHKECAVCHRPVCTQCVIRKRVLAQGEDFIDVVMHDMCKKCVQLIRNVDLRDPTSLDSMCEQVVNGSSAFYFSTTSATPASFRTGAYSDTYEKSQHSSSYRSGPREGSFHSAQRVESYHSSDYQSDPYAGSNYGTAIEDSYARSRSDASSVRSGSSNTSGRMRHPMRTQVPLESLRKRNMSDARSSSTKTSMSSENMALHGYSSVSDEMALNRLPEAAFVDDYGSMNIVNKKTLKSALSASDLAENQQEPWDTRKLLAEIMRMNELAEDSNRLVKQNRQYTGAYGRD